MKRYALLLAAAVALTGGTAVAGEIYKWIDDEGNIHYEDRPTSGATIERVAIASRNTDNAAVQERMAANREARATAAQVASEAPPKMSRQEIRAEQQKRKEKCEQSRARLETFTNARRLYRENESGEREYLDDAEISTARSQIEEQIKEYCGS